MTASKIIIFNGAYLSEIIILSFPFKITGKQAPRKHIYAVDGSCCQKSEEVLIYYINRTHSTASYGEVRWCVL